MVTGGAGFIGSHLSELLVNFGHSVKAIDNLSMGKRSNLRSLENNNRFKLYNADILDISDIKNLFEDVDWIFHLAGVADIVPSIDNPELYFNTNVIGTYNIVKLAREFRVKKLIYAASSSCYGIPSVFPTDESTLCDPKYPYALTKYLGEQILMHWASIYNLPSISLRLFNVYGPRARTTGTYGAVFGVFLAQKLAGIPYTVVGDGTQTRDFTYVTDVSSAFLAAAESPYSHEIFNVGSGATYQINHLVKLLEGPTVNIPKRPGEPDCTFADITKIKAQLCWSPRVTFEEGVSLMKGNLNDWKDAPLWDTAKIEHATKSWFQYLKKSEIRKNEN